MKKKTNNKGFSLIELIIAIAILVVLTGMLAPQFMRYIEKSREAKDAQAMDTVYSAVQMALAEEDVYAEMIENTKTETYKVELADASGKFGTELKSVLGELNDDKLALISKSAGTGKICIAVKYDEDSFKIAVYCGTTTSIVGNLAVVGDKDVAPEKTAD